MPPTLRELLADPVFRMYYTRQPRLPETLQWGEPWQVWAVTHEGRWGSRMFATYAEAFSKLMELYKKPDKFRDMCIVSRRVLYPPPNKAFWRASLYSWCSRCRRPSEFRQRSPDHHALRSQPVLTEDAPRRCFYCGIRKAAMPHYAPGDLR
jgi:hypothetical protein